MLKLGFDNRWVDLMMLCVSTVCYNVLVHGREVGPIIPKRGLRQGDPLSPYLFILCAEGLSSSIKRAESEGLLHHVGSIGLDQLFLIFFLQTIVCFSSELLRVNVM